MIGLALTPEQFTTLLRVAYIANTIANAHRDDGDFLDEYDDFEQFIFARAKDAGFEGATWRHEVNGEAHHHPSPIFEQDPALGVMMDMYDTHTAYEVLAEKLAERDMEKKYGPNAKDRMPAHDYEELLVAIAEEYAHEFATNDFKNVRIEKS